LRIASALINFIELDGCLYALITLKCFKTFEMQVENGAKELCICTKHFEFRSVCFLQMEGKTSKFQES